MSLTPEDLLQIWGDRLNRIEAKLDNMATRDDIREAVKSVEDDIALLRGEIQDIHRMKNSALLMSFIAIVGVAWDLLKQRVFGH